MLGSTVDVVVREASADVFVERIGGDAEGDLDSILLPTAGGPHAELAAETAAAIARTEGSSVEVLMVVDEDATAADRRTAEALVAGVAEGLADLDVTTRVAAGDVVDTIVDATADHDLTIIWATQEGLLQELVFGAIPVEVGQRAGGTVIMTKRYLGITSRLRRWLRGK